MRGIELRELLAIEVDVRPPVDLGALRTLILLLAAPGRRAAFNPSSTCW